MAYSNFDRKGRRKKARRKNRYETQMVGQEEIEIIEAGRIKNGVDDSNGTNSKTSN